MIELAAAPPLLRVANDPIVLNGERLAELSRRRPILENRIRPCSVTQTTNTERVTYQVVANKPRPRPIQELAFVLLIDNFGRAWQVKVEVGGHANSKTKIEPFAGLFPLARRKGIDRHEDVSLADLDALPAIDQSVGCRRLGKVHGNRVQLWAFRVVPGRNGANCCTV